MIIELLTLALLILLLVYLYCHPEHSLPRRIKYRVVLMVLVFILIVQLSHPQPEIIS